MPAPRHPGPPLGRRGNHSAAPSGAARTAGGRRGRARNPPPGSAHRPGRPRPVVGAIARGSGGGRGPGGGSGASPSAARSRRTAWGRRLRQPIGMVGARCPRPILWLSAARAVRTAAADSPPGWFPDRHELPPVHAELQRHAPAELGRRSPLAGGGAGPECATLRAGASRVTPPPDDTLPTARNTAHPRGLRPPWRPGQTANPHGRGLSLLTLAARIRLEEPSRRGDPQIVFLDHAGEPISMAGRRRPISRRSTSGCRPPPGSRIGDGANPGTRSSSRTRRRPEQARQESRAMVEALSDRTGRFLPSWGARDALAARRAMLTGTAVEGRHAVPSRRGGLITSVSAVPIRRNPTRSDAFSWDIGRDWPGPRSGCRLLLS